ncbi:alpha/beta hydrolase [Herbiconiux sp. CPCC 203407]|uniref:Alpha/beta hydrolase n=1 Tax=Herbiconiux oxytropis TaxID=2970915 RepID=A0AA41XHG6_9MICO|nr:alpha/beta hydrolase [Herbiconiux oxytropis]MCS5722642.1 alpha/beta hydrolase [Herbiconiux oxytropis]MCS5726344.1 alpha/beta hydrolase [Herbiconiux oxytropis]
MDPDALEQLRVPTSLGPVAVRLLVAEQRPREDAEALVLLHGAAGSWTTWLPLLEEAERRHTLPGDVVLLDLPGWGESPLPGHDRSVDGYGRAVAEVLRSLGYERWRAVGHSLGGVIALHLAAIEPAATRAVGLVSPTTFGVAEASRHPLWGLRLVAPYVALRAVMSAMARLSPSGRATAALLAGLRRLHLLRVVFAPLFAEPSRVSAAVLVTLAAEVRPVAFAAAARAAAAYRPGEVWAGIRCRVVSVRGARDVFVTVHDDRMLERTVPGAVTRVLGRAGHFGHIEAPGDVLAALGAHVLTGEPTRSAS